MSILHRYAVLQCLLMLLLFQQPAWSQEYRSCVLVQARLHALETLGAESHALQAEMVTQLEKMQAKIRAVLEQTERQERRHELLNTSLAERSRIRRGQSACLWLFIFGYCLV